MLSNPASRPLWLDPRAITAWEYALIGAVVALLIVSSLTVLGTATLKSFQSVNSAIARS
jgi:Flp pilus assembly pilin Flp